ncbi:MAG: hypothetical protein ABIH42_07500 [Planctomycetota bacterium]
MFETQSNTGKPVGPWNSKKVQICRAISSLTNVPETTVYGIVNDYLKFVAFNLIRNKSAQIYHFGSFRQSIRIPKRKEAGQSFLSKLFGGLFAKKQEFVDSKTTTHKQQPSIKVVFRPSTHLLKHIEGTSEYIVPVIAKAKQKDSRFNPEVPDLPSALKEAKSGNLELLNEVIKWMQNNKLSHKAENLKHKYL